MENKTINKEIRKVSNYTSLPLLCYFVLYILLTVGIEAIGGRLYYSGVITDVGVFQFAAYIVLYLGIVPVSMLIFYKTRGKRTGQTLISCFAKPQKSVGWIIKWLLISLGIIYLTSLCSNMIFTIIESLTGYTLTSKDFQLGDSTLGNVTIVIALMFFAPFFEELLFRGTMYRSAEPMGQWFAVILTGVMFGMWHLNYTQLLFAVVMGIFSCLLFLKTRSIIPSMILHFILNSVSVVQLTLLQGVDLDSLETADLSYISSHLVSILGVCMISLMIMALIITAIALLVIEIVNHKGRMGLYRCSVGIKPVKKLAVYFSAPVTIIVFVFMAAAIVLNAMGILAL